MDGLRLASDRGINGQLERLPLGRVSHLHAAPDDIWGSAEPSGADDRPPIGAAREGDLFRSDRYAPEENDEARGRRRSSNRLTTGRERDLSAQHENSCPDTMGRR